MKILIGTKNPGKIKGATDALNCYYKNVELYSDGGESKTCNIMVLCKDCHDEIHRHKSLDIPLPEADFIDEDNND